VAAAGIDAIGMPSTVATRSGLNRDSLHEHNALVTSSTFIDDQHRNS
jgi:hypothetical protein